MDKSRLCELLEKFKAVRVAVIGDFFLDKYLEILPELSDFCIENGKPAHAVIGTRHSPGAAGNVVLNLSALGAGEIYAIGIVGDDGDGFEMTRDLNAARCDTRYLLRDPNAFTLTYLKPHDITVPGLEGEFERFHSKNRYPLAAEPEQKLIESLREVVKKVDAVLVADQMELEDRGTITRAVRQALSKFAHENPDKIFFVDSRNKIGLFEGLTLKPNETEAVRAFDKDFCGEIDDDTAIAAGKKLAAISGKTVFLTRAERGIWLTDQNGCEVVPTIHIDPPIDPTGAGDTASAAAALALASGATPKEAALVANLCSSIVVKCISTTGTASPEQLPERLEEWVRQNGRG